MSYNIHLSIPEVSSGGYLIASPTALEHITPSQAVERIITKAAQRETAEPVRNFIKEGRDLFGKPEDAQILDEALAIALEERRRPSTQTLA